MEISGIGRTDMIIPIVHGRKSEEESWYLLRFIFYIVCGSPAAPSYGYLIVPDSCIDVFLLGIFIWYFCQKSIGNIHMSYFWNSFSLYVFNYPQN